MNCMHHAKKGRVVEEKQKYRIKEKKKESFSFMPLGCRVGYRQTSTTPKGFIYLSQPITVTSHQSQGFIPKAVHQAFHLTDYNNQTFKSYQTPYSLLTQHSNLMEPIHLSYGQPTKQLPTHIVLAIHSFPILSIHG